MHSLSLLVDKQLKAVPKDNKLMRTRIGLSIKIVRCSKYFIFPKLYATSHFHFFTEENPFSFVYKVYSEKTFELVNVSTNKMVLRRVENFHIQI